jgi:hypothetical protein
MKTDIQNEKIIHSDEKEVACPEWCPNLPKASSIVV